MTHPLAERLADADPEERRAACRAALQDPAAAALTEALTEALGDPVKAVVRAASDALVEIGRTFGGVEAPLRRALHSNHPGRRFGAAFTSARLETPGPRLLPALVEALGNRDGDVRWAAARLIVETGRLHGEVLPLLVGLVRSDESAVVRRMATFALRELAPDRPEAAAVLLEALDDADLHVRRAATTAMASLMAPPPAVAERLLRALREDADAATRRLAALALGELGAHDPDALPPAALDHLVLAGGEVQDPDLQRAVRRAMARLKAGRPD